MIAHIVLFEPRQDLAAADRQAFAVSFERALTGIKQVKRARVGERLTLGRLYDQLNTRDFPYMAILEFDSEADLRAYLDHPAHQELGERFYQTAQATLVYDFELTEGGGVGRVFGSRD